MPRDDDWEMDGEVAHYGPRKRSVTVNGKATSVSMTDAEWRELGECATSRGLSVNALLSGIKSSNPGNLNRAIRLFIVNARLGGVSERQ